jgi:membrane-bound lytic murein transglycosylase D
MQTAAYDHVEPLPDDGKYVVVSGDSLWAISQRYGVTVQDLKRWNHISDHHGLQIGRAIKVKE